MRWWRRVLGNAATVLASTLFAIALLEVVLRFFPVAWAPPVQPPTADNPIQRYAPNTPYTWSLGWDFYAVVHGQSNAQGFIANYDYDAKATAPLVAVVGDSFVEALQVPFSESLTGRLQTAMGERGRAYAFAQSGSPLSQYIAYIEHAAATYRPQKVVVVVVENDFDESVYAHRKRDGIYHLYPQPGGGFDFKLTPLPEPSLLERILRHSALALYLVRNVGVSNLTQWFSPKPAQAAEASNRDVKTTDTPDPARIAEGEQVIAWFLTVLPKAAALAPTDIVIAVDAIRPMFDDSTALTTAHGSYFGQLRTSLIRDAKAQGFQVIDLDMVFRAAYRVDRIPLEFRTDRHWNSHAHAVAASAAIEALHGWAPLH
jgi:hypothetical protein